MTQNLWQKKPKLNYSEDVFDIVQFGSSTQEESTPKDIDIAVIFQKISLKSQLTQAQEIKSQLTNQTNLPIHIKSFDLYTLFDKSNFAKEGILHQGKSVLTGKYFAETFNLLPKTQITYTLNDLPKKDKVRLNYSLTGRGGKYNLLKKHNATFLKPGLIEVSPETEQIFIKKIKNVTDKFEVRKIFLQS